jgi:hypothetical protein
VYVPEFTVKFPVPEYGAVPPFPETVITPVPPKVEIGVEIAEPAARLIGSVTTIVVVELHPFTSVTV